MSSSLRGAECLQHSVSFSGSSGLSELTGGADHLAGSGPEVAEDYGLLLIPALRVLLSVSVAIAVPLFGSREYGSFFFFFNS